MQVPEHLKVASKIEPEYSGGIINNGEAHDTELTGLTGIKTKYNEDAYIGSHTTVWGSFFCITVKKWGFKCCKSTDKNSVKCAVAEALRAPLLKQLPIAASAVSAAQ